MCNNDRKKYTALLLSGLLLLGALAGCEAGAEVPGSPAAAVESPAPVAETATAPVSTVAPTPEEAAASPASAEPSPSAAPAAEATPAPTPAAASVVVDPSGATAITLSGASASVKGTGAAVDGGVVTITKGGTYTVTGTLIDGRIIVNAKGEEVTLVLNGADITCSYGSPIYIYKSKLAVIQLGAGTQNTLTDGAAYTFADSFSSAPDEEPNACLYSKADLVIQGPGALTVNANYNNGITGKDTLVLREGVITVNAVNHGVNGKDSNTLDGVTLTVTCGGDGVRSTNDSDPTLGWVSLTNAKLTLTAGEDGVQAETWCSIQGGSYAITTGGGNAARTDDSAKGVKAGGALTLLDGAFVMDCADDAFHSNADLTVSGGAYTVSTGDDAFHADGTLTVQGGAIDILTSYEGLEGSDVNVTGGTISLVARDDGVNAAGGADGSGFMDRGGMMKGAFGAATSGGSHTLTISGGTLRVVAGGDGLDANGSLVLSGGDVMVYSSSAGMGDGPLDSDAGVTLSGGTVFAYGNTIFQAPASPAQNTVAVYFERTVAAGSQLTITSGAKTWTYVLSGQANSMVFSAPELKAGDELTVACDGEALAQATLNAGLTSSGQMSAGMGMQGGKGGMGGHTGWQQFGGQPTDGGARPDGQTGGKTGDRGGEQTQSSGGTGSGI